jgi:His/Glu/Gln/Arg/opine family amino acid ABC transporter permease subunit
MPFEIALISRVVPALAQGLHLTLALSALAIVLSSLWGIAVVLGLMSPVRPLSVLTRAYIEVVRNTPVLVQMYFIFFGLSMGGLRLSGWQAGLLALVLQNGAYVAEIYRAGIADVGRRQREAGLALGMHRVRVFVQVILPQATKIAIPNIGSMFIGMVKDTSTFTVIGLLEVVRVTQNLNSTTFQPFVLYTAAAGVYVVTAFILDFVFRSIEKSLTAPPAGAIGRAATARRRRRVEDVVLQAQALSGRN